MLGSGCAEHVQAYLRCSKGGDMAFSLYCWPSLILVAYWLSAYAVGGHLCSFPPPPPPPPPPTLIIALRNACIVYLRIMITTCFITMAVATCTVSIPPLLPTEVVSCVVSLKFAFMSS